MNYETTPEFMELREQALELTADKAGLDGDPFGLIMETGYAEGVGTLVALSDGSASLYMSAGGGVLGAGQYPEPQAVSRALVAYARQFRMQFQVTKEFPLPEPGQVRFYLLTENGVRVAEGTEVGLGKSTAPLSPLFHAAHHLLGEIIYLQKQAEVVQHERGESGDAGDDEDDED